MNAASGLLLGLVYVAPPGPINAETIRRGLAGGVSLALSLQLGALLVDVVYAVLALHGASLVLAHSALRPALGIGEMALLLYLGGASLRDGVRGLRSAPSHHALAAAAPVSRRHLSLRVSLMTGAALSLVNPATLTFWLAVGGAVTRPMPDHGMCFLLGFFLGDLLWAIALPVLIGWRRATLNARIFHYSSILCGVIFIACAVTVGRSLA